MNKILISVYLNLNNQTVGVPLWDLAIYVSTAPLSTLYTDFVNENLVKIPQVPYILYLYNHIEYLKNSIYNKRIFLNIFIIFLTLQ